MSTVTIIDYGSGNLRSAAKAFERAAREAGTDDEILVTDDVEAVRRADRIVLPGVGAFADCRAGLDAVTGMVEVLEERVIRGGAPFLGICVGMQLMASEGREKATTRGLGWIPGAVVRLEPKGDLKVPHMGWNTLTFHKPHPLLEGIPDGAAGLHAYFVHSYHLATERPETLVATAEYGQQVTAIVGRDNLLGTQFHPEKSQTLGLTLIRNFLGWKP
ncbi:MAG TPA: imidazole glycerol phosphate synthase subunit HisH [Devosia sp.]|jgi:glutamine amidotransferase|uniref:imidazole glycerol phosphate synthase subunit HisH n=1 Tax=Devosia sp. TaxID=1871048 RepID=UPI002DDCA7CF|nr:imidazole glycerol phosphate synthase subunit HisH [Devosia sp.]HEV2513893.1 imidazole glycerol phosphate synthase subunit HisH [Devosia sp.]